MTVPKSSNVKLVTVRGQTILICMSAIYHNLTNWKLQDVILLILTQQIQTSYREEEEEQEAEREMEREIVSEMMEVETVPT